MKKIWTLIGFKPSSFTLPDDQNSDDEYDRPVFDGLSFPRNDGNCKSMEDNSTHEKLHTGLSISNFDVSLKEEDVVQFLKEHVSKNINDSEVDILRDERKLSATINANLSTAEIQAALKKINFADCKQKLI